MRIKQQKKFDDNFIQGVITTVTRRFKEFKKDVTLVDYFTMSDKVIYDLSVVVQHGILYWSVRQVGTPDIAGGGWFVYVDIPSPILKEFRAALLPPHQKQGIYPWVLKTLRKHFGRPLESDYKLSQHNQKAWLKAGVLDPVSRVVRVNPPSKKPQVLSIIDQIRLSWLATERRLPPGWKK